MSFAVFVHLAGEAPVTNAVRFATREEAIRAGEELLSRWFTPTTFEVRETEDAVNYTFPETSSRPERIEV